MVSVPNVPSNSRVRFVAAVLSASCWSIDRSGWRWSTCMESSGVGSTVGGTHGRGDPGDAVGEVDDDPVEGRVLAGPGGVGNGPVQPARARVVSDAVRGEFLVGGVADGDDKTVRSGVGAQDV